jgi:uncharacterized protein
VPERTAIEVPAPGPVGWIGVGAVAGALNPLVGVTGPLFAPLFKAAGLAPTGHLPTVAAGIVGVVVGTELGSRLLDRLSEQRFRSLYLVAITAVAAYLVVDGVVGAG